MCSPGYLFVGSRLGNSTLIHYNRERIHLGNQTASEDLKADLQKSFSDGIPMESNGITESNQLNVEDAEDEVDAYFYGDAKKTSVLMVCVYF